MTSLAIIICTWNRADSLNTTLLSLRQQVVPAGVAVEVIVVDNNSGDDTGAVVERLRPGWAPGQLRYAFEPRQGKQFALNTGINLSGAALLAFTDDDILFPPDWISAICAAFADPQLELAGGKTLLGWPGAGAPRWYAPAMQAILGGVDLGSRRLLPPPPGYAPAGANLVARRSLFDRVGQFSPTHFRHMDYEFGLRCAAARAVVAYDPALVVQAPVDPGMLSKRYFRRWSFKAGFARSDDPKATSTLFGAPRWVYAQLLQDLLLLPFDWLARSPDAAFTRELRLLRGWGTVASAWYARLWPEHYPQWVERHSQKKKNLY